MQLWPAAAAACGPVQLPHSGAAACHGRLDTKAHTAQPAQLKRTFDQLLQQRQAQRGPLCRVGAGAQLVQQQQRSAVGLDAQRRDAA